MQTEEKAIIEYLKGWPNTFVAGREIARKAMGRRYYEEDRSWAVSVLALMDRKGILESDHLGSFRLVQKEDTRKKRAKKHFSPQILKILQSSGQNFETIVLDDDTEGEEIKPLHPNTQKFRDGGTV